MDWVKDPHGNYLNIQSAVSGKVIDGRGGPRVELKDARGNTVGITSPDVLEPPACVLAGPIACVFVSAAAEAVWRCVAAWRINGDNAEPIIVGTRPAGRLHLEFNSGELVDVESGRRFPDLKTATQACREAAAEQELVQ